MKVFTERRSGVFLKKIGFNIVESFYVEDKSGIKNAVEKIGLPCVVKVFGDKVIHKKKLGGVALGVKSYEEVLEIYDKFKKIKDAEGIVVQKEIRTTPQAYTKEARVPLRGPEKSSTKIFTKGNEFLIGVQKTADFGHVVGFGIGGSNVEKLKKVYFRVCPFDKKEALELINETFKNLLIEDKKILIGVLLRCCKLIKKFPKIKELDINPLVIFEGRAIVLDSRIVWEN